MATILIVNEENKLFEYEILANIHEYHQPEELALTRYITEQLGFKALFNMDEELYELINRGLSDIGVKLSLVNHLCASKSQKIMKMYNGQRVYVPALKNF